ncbi:MAG: alpha/beta fold hydrolase [Corynebacterium sp.]
MVDHGVDLVTIDGGGHSMTMQSPDEVAGIITAFIDELLDT